MRLRLHQAVGAAYRATLHNAPNHRRLQDELARNRNELRVQFERQFAPELDRLAPAERDAVVAAGDVLTQLDAVDQLRSHRRLTVDQATDVLRIGLQRLLGGDR